MALSNRNIIVVGAGLSGLVSIIEAINYIAKYPDSRYNLHIIEKRSIANPNRRQKLILIPSNQFPRSKHATIDWEEYCEKLFDPYGEIKRKFKNKPESKPINKREGFLFKLYRQEVYYKDPLRDEFVRKNFSIKELQLALLEYIKEKSNGININWHEQSSITKIDVDNNELEIKNTHGEIIKLNFDDILICEGTKRETIQALNDEIPNAFTYKEFKHPSLYHCALRLKLKTNLDTDSSSPNFFAKPKSEMDFIEAFKKNYQKPISKEQLLEKFKQMGHKADTLPNLYVIEDNFYKSKYPQDNFCLRLHVASEIPKEIHEIANPEEKRKTIIKWATTIASMSYGIPEQFFEFDSHGETEKSKLNALTFENKLEFVENPVLILPSGKRIFLVGDASMSNYYPAGFSSLIALTEACSAAKLALNPNLKVDPYIELFNYYRVILEDKIEQLGKLLRRDFDKEYETQQRSNATVTRQPF